ncbi:rhodanese-like domain-containing protein [Fictibacillus terranigra]|uniref:rhodanese-like domain-containing protein n=1 Tax=Fictibacillus terranigra TaxID=3058424 RepID=UPI0033906892
MLSDVINYEEVKTEWIYDAVQKESVFVLDVRNTSEWKQGHIPQAMHVMLGDLQNQHYKIPNDKPRVFIVN